MAITMDGRELGARTGSLTREPPGSAERARAFRLARRHTLIVKVLRIGMPVGAACFVGFYALTLGMSWKLGPGRLSVGEIQLTPDDMTMKNPTYFGVNKDGGRYEVRAKKAVVAFNKDAPVKLIDIDGDLIQLNGVVTKLKAKHGLLDNAKNELELWDNIEIDGSNGLKARLSRAMIFSKKHLVVSKHPVEVEMPSGRVVGDTMTMHNDTRETNFVGNVKTHLVPATQAGQVAATPAFGRDQRQPVDVDSDELYVNDTKKTALFTGNVLAVQGESTLRTPELHVSYEGKAADQLTAAAPQQGGETSRLSRIIAKKGSDVTIGTDRRVTSDEADFDAKANTALFTGDVVVTQQRNILRGQRLFVDRKTSQSRLETPADGGQPEGRITARFYQNENKAGPQPKPKTAAVAAQESVLGSFKTDPNAPIDVESDTLDVDDHTKEAVFRGNVKSQQGDVVVRTVEMTAHYTGQAGFGLASGGNDPAGKTPSQLTRVEARRKVLVTSKDGQTATGDWADFDLKANTVLMGDRVIVSRGKDVAEGPRLKIDLTTGMYRFELESTAATPRAAPSISASPPLTPPGQPVSTDPAARSCPPGKQCLLFYPKEAQKKAKEAVKKLHSDAPGDKAGEDWQPTTSPPQRGN